MICPSDYLITMEALGLIEWNKNKPYIGRSLKSVAGWTEEHSQHREPQACATAQSMVLLVGTGSNSGSLLLQRPG